jgi:protein-tyrosine phosphatase
MAMALLRNRLSDMDLQDSWVVDSAGTWGMEGYPATDHAIQTVAERGLDLNSHLSRRVTEGILQKHDLVLTMTQDHQEGIQTEFPHHAVKVYMLSEIIGERFDIQDPVGRPLEAYRATVEKLDRILEEGMDRIIEIARSNAVSQN